MKNPNLINKIYKTLSVIGRRSYCTKSRGILDVQYVRNVGILAHIDAGKTTTTERMLYYSGVIRSMGEVHHGNTVTDFMDQERERGITITSASVTFPWKDHTFNLIDTPGHIDFTMEVEQTLNVLDGGIIILDGSAGVEAQTLTVWKQSEKYKIPKIVYLNKSDRPNLDVRMCLNSIESKLETPAFLMHIPLKYDGKLAGIMDIVTLEKILWEIPERGKFLQRVALTEESDKQDWELAVGMRNLVIDKLSDHDDLLADAIIQSESVENISAETMAAAVRRVTCAKKGVPVFCGSSYKNIGVQPLMDAVISYLPSPLERNKQFKCFDDHLCARAFKVMHESQRGPLVFFRIYSGTFTKGQKIYNVHQNITEQTGRLLVAYADDFQEVDEITSGNIAVVTGLKKTVSGDLISATQTALSLAKKNLSKTRQIIEGHDVNEIFDIQRIVPEPVFFCSIEPPSLASQMALESALRELQREDPSLRVKQHPDTSQTVLAGMGELHLEIIKDRIKKKYKIDAELGELQIAYREAPISFVKALHSIDSKIGNSKQYVNISMSISPSDKVEAEVLLLDKGPDAASNLSNLHPRHLLAVKQGVDVALNYGPKMGCPVVNVSAMLHFFEIGRGTSDNTITAAVTQCIQKLLSDSGTRILEPVMALEIVTFEEHLSQILADLSRRRTDIQQIDVRGQNKVVYSLSPLSELLGYATDLRTLTSGTGTFTMEFHAYREMSPVDEENAIKRVTGF